MKMTEFFDRTYVVNLPERRDRRREMAQELANAGIALAPNQVEFFRAIRPESAGDFPGIGALGCFLSHLSILKQAQKLKLKNVLIFEDDLAISKEFLAQQATLISQLQQQDWGMVYFGHRIAGLSAAATETDSASNFLLSSYNGPIETTHFYGVNGQILDRLVAFFEQVQQRPAGHPDGGPMHVDAAYSMFRAQQPDVITLVANANLGWQRSSRSDITCTAWYDQLPVTRNIMDVARAGKNLLLKK